MTELGITLVACAKDKLPHAAMAQDMYTTRTFRARKQLAMQDDMWFILSSEYGLLHPETEIEPYENYMKFWSAADRNHWQRVVLAQLLFQLTVQNIFVKQITIHAGAFYYKPVMINELRQEGYNVVLPTEGMSVSKTFQHLKGMLNGS